MFDGGIDLYIEAGYDSLYNAFQIAKDHVPERTAEIATLIFDGYTSHENHKPEIYLESARLLGNEDDAKIVLSKEAKEIKINDTPRQYEGLVNALIDLGLNTQAHSLARKIERYEIRQMKRADYYRGRYRTLADIFLTVGNKEKAVEALSRKIDRESQGYMVSDFMPDIKRAYKLSGDNKFLDQKRIAFEDEGEYYRAERTARKLGRKDLEEIYSGMREMIAQAKASR